MLEVSVTDEFIGRYNKLEPTIRRQARKQEKLFVHNPFHPSLHTEKLEPKHRSLWSIRVDKKYRILLRFIDHSHVVFLSIGTHDWIYHMPWHG